jgi:hypothetical protein
MLFLNLLQDDDACQEIPKIISRNVMRRYEFHHVWGWVKTLVPLVNIKIAGKWMFIPLKMVLIGIDPYPYIYTLDLNPMIDKQTNGEYITNYQYITNHWIIDYQ